MRLIKFSLAFFLPLLAMELWGAISLSSILFSAVFCLFLSFALNGLKQNSWWQLILKLLLTIIYLSILFFTFLEAAIFDFTGQGFTDEVYYHVSYDAFRVGLEKYGWGLLALVILMVAVTFGILKWTRKQIYSVSTGLIFCGLTLIVTNFTVEGRFLWGWVNYYQDEKVVVPEKTVEQWKEKNIIQSDRVPMKQLIQASMGQKNLILIYLESFNQFLLDTPPFQALTPGLNQLATKYQTFGHENSAYVTIEGIVSSQCGTLLTMKKGNDSLMRADQFLVNLPCLGDVLAQSGYQQSYLGGAKMEFAGKGSFLEAHGFTELKGLEYWESENFKTDEIVWGLGDGVLFSEAFDQISRLHGQPEPFNVTLLTLGTHLPGFTFSECQGLELNENRFLAAIQCTDFLLTQFINRLEQAGFLKDSLLVVIADHGVFPNPRMKSLFGDLIYDRRLVGLTNYDLTIPDQPMASYDLAPTILDWLDIKHNATFLFGQSIYDETHDSHQHLTRYMDWFNGKLIGNPKDCEETGGDVLNFCEKSLLSHWITEQHMSKSETVYLLTLECQPELIIDLLSVNKQLSFDGVNLYNKFHHNGFYLSKRQYQLGWFLLEYNELKQVSELKYWPDNISDQEVVQHKMDSKEAGAIMIHVSQSGGPNIEVKSNNKWTPADQSDINLCP